jgi:anti-sigma B factor antagonist
MRASGETCGNLPLVVLEGEIDHGNMQDFARAVQSAPRNTSTESLLLDLTQVSYIDSGGLSVIYSTMHGLPTGAYLGLVGAQPNVLRILEVGGIRGQAVVRLFDSREEACEALDPATGAEKERR